jgi:hypothetical protein
MAHLYRVGPQIVETSRENAGHSDVPLVSKSPAQGGEVTGGQSRRDIDLATYVTTVALDMSLPLRTGQHPSSRR